MKQLITNLAVLPLIILLPIIALAGGETVGARAAALGRTSVSSTDFWSIQNNPAGMAMQTGFAAGVYYENRFLLKELSLKSAAIVAPTRFGVIGVSFNQFGFNLYNENKIGLAYARSFGDLLRIGLQLDYQMNSIGEGYKNASFVTFELGVQTTVNDKLSLGAFVYNPMHVKISAFADENAPTVMRIGLNYAFMPEFIGLFEIEKNFETNASLHFGLEYDIQHKFFIRSGISTNPGLFTMGAGIHFKRVQLHIAASMHQTLGISTQAGLIFQLVKEPSNE